jgi:hypothetical protein
MRTRLIVIGRKFVERIIIEDIDYIQIIASNRIKLQIQNSGGSGSYKTELIFEEDSDVSYVIGYIRDLMLNPTGLAYKLEIN